MKKQSIFALVLSLVMIFSSFSATSLSVSAAQKRIGDITVSFNSSSEGDNIKTKVRYPVMAASTSLGKTYIASADCYYSDGYFTAPSNEFNQHLATMSFAFALSSFTLMRGSADTCYDRARELLSSVGYTDFESNAETDYVATPDTIGVVIAKKTILEDGKPYTVLAIAVRGGGYGSEWASNFLVGRADELNGNHKGFYQSRDRALEFIKDYISRNVEGDVKIWLTGYSRGGAVSGLIGAWFDDNLENLSELGISLEHKDLFAYTVEAPASTEKKNLSGKNYSNIFNIFNTGDFVPRVPFSGNEAAGWNFARPGVEVPFDNISKDDAAKINAILKSINPDSLYDMHNFSSFLPVFGDTQSKFLDNLISNLTARIDRATYVEKIQTPFVEILGNLTAYPDDEMKEIALVVLGDVAADLGVSSNIDMEGLIRLISSFTADDTSTESIVAAVGKSLKKNGIIKEYNTEVQLCISTFVDALLKDNGSGTNLTFFIINMIANTVSYKADNGKEMTQNRILSAHDPEVVLAMLTFFDSYYSDTPSKFESVDVKPQKPNIQIPSLDIIKPSLDGGKIELSPLSKDEETALPESAERIVEVKVRAGENLFSSYYYNGDEVVIKASSKGCLYVSGFAFGEEKLSDSDEYSFIAKGSVTLDLLTLPNHVRVSDWITEKKPTEQEVGVKYKACVDCGARVDEAVVPKLASKSNVEQAEADGLAAGAIIAVCAAALVSAAAMAALVISKKKKKAPEGEKQ